MSQSNGQQTITAGSWTNIGTGPLTINLQSLSLSVNVVISDTKPADGAQGNILSQSRPSMQVSNAQAVWVRGVPSWTNSSGTAIIDVLLGTPGASGGGASEAHIGEVGGNVKRIVPAIANIAGTAYTTGMVVGGLIELQNAARVANGSGLITSARLGTKIANSSGVQFDLVLFASKPSGTYSDGAALTIAAADLPLVSKVLHISDWTQLGAAASHGQAPAEPRFFLCADTVNSPTSLWGLLVIRGSLTFSTTSDLALSLTVQRN